MHKFFQPSPHDQKVIMRRDRRYVIENFNSVDTQNIWVGGMIVNVDDTTPLKVFHTGEVMCWPENGKPIDQLIIDIETDDGTVIRFYIKHDNVYDCQGDIQESTRYWQLLHALDKAKLFNQLPRTGDLLFMRWTGREKGPGWNRTGYRKIWEIRYERVENND